MREHDPKRAGEGDLTAGKPVHTRTFLRHIAITERAMVRTVRPADRLHLITTGCSVSDRRARRLIKAVNMLWHYRAQAYGTPAKARTKLLPLAQHLYEEALSKGQLTPALGALRLQAELCGLSKLDVVALPIGDVHTPGEISANTADVADRVMDRLLAHGLNGGSKSGNGKSNGNGHGPS